MKFEIKFRAKSSIHVEAETFVEAVVKSKSYLQEANLWGADLWGADLQGANLQEAYLWGAYLQGADLREANLRGADLQGADLQGANLQEAYLREANLRGANLQEADLREAYLDFSCWPLWCGSANAEIDERIARQLLAHAFAVAGKFCPPTEEQIKFINEFHRIKSGEFPAIEYKDKGE